MPILKGVRRLVDLSALAGAAEIWDEWRYEPWKNGSAAGLYRRLTMVKSSLMGEIARYYADDYLIWKYAPGDVERLMREAKPEKDLMVQRYVFISDNGSASFKKKSFLLGFRGFIEIYQYPLGTEVPDGIVDVAHLCNAAKRSLTGKS